jgi:hypothetical protein
MNNLHLIEVKYIPASNTLGSRVALRSLRFNTRVVIPFDHAMNQCYEMAEAYLKQNGIADTQYRLTGNKTIGVSHDEKRGVDYIIIDAGKYGVNDIK